VEGGRIACPRGWKGEGSAPIPDHVNPRGVPIMKAQFAPFQMMWDWSTWDQQYGATRDGVYKAKSKTFMQMPACTPLKLRKNMMELPDKLDLQSMGMLPEI
jgi:hypothetical protein